MRTLSGLYEITLEYYLKGPWFDGYHLTGICVVMAYLDMKGIISFSERLRLNRHFAKQHNPAIHEDIISYWWNENDRPPRVKILKMLIKKTNRKPKKQRL